MSKKTIFILISLVLSVVLILVFVKPLWGSVRVLRTEMAKQEQRVESVEELLVKAQELEQKYQDMGGDVDKISLALPKEKDLPYLITQFETLASNNGLLLESVNFQGVEKEESVKKRERKSSEQKGIAGDFSHTPIKLTLSGSYEGLKGYLESLESNVRLMDVGAISFDKEEKGEESSLIGFDIFDFSLDIVVYYQ